MGGAAPRDLLAVRYNPLSYAPAPPGHLHVPEAGAARAASFLVADASIGLSQGREPSGVRGAWERSEPLTAASGAPEEGGEQRHVREVECNPLRAGREEGVRRA